MIEIRRRGEIKGNLNALKIKVYEWLVKKNWNIKIRMTKKENKRKWNPRLNVR